MTLTHTRITHDVWRGLGLECKAAIAISLLFFFTALLVTNRGNPYADEAMDAEIPLNIAIGDGQVSFAHANCTPGTPSALVSPAYTYALAAWLALLPQARATVLAFNCLAVAASSLAIWAATVRSSLLATPGWRLTLLAFLPLIPPLLQVYGTNRYDSVAVLGYGLAALLLTLPATGLTLSLMIACGFFTGSGGMHCAISALPLSALIAILFGKAATRHLCAGLAGVTLGLLATFALIFSSEEMTASFWQALQIDNVSPAMSVADYLRAPLRGGHPSMLRGGNIFLFLALLLLVTTEPKRGTWTLGMRFGIYGLASGILVPLTLTAVGRYSFTYAWLAGLPMAVGVFALASQRSAYNTARMVAVPLLLAAALPGFPLKAAITALDWNVNSYNAVSSFVTDNIHQDDVVYASYGAYYPVKWTAASCFFGTAIHAMTPTQRTEVTAVVLNEDDLQGSFFSPSKADIFDALGGSWRQEALLTVPRSKLRTAIPITPLGVHVFKYRIYRRDHH